MSTTQPGQIDTGHGAKLTVNLGAIVGNWRHLNLLTKGAECSAVVKANAYGLGANHVVHALAEAGCRTFFVAHVEEGVAVRRVASHAVVYVLNGLPPGVASLYAEHDLRPVLGSLAEIDEWAAFIASGGFPGQAALHIETGMNRLGLSGDEMREAAARFTARTLGFPVSLIMSHFVAADEPASPLNGRQIADFTAARALFASVPASLANSSGIFLGHRAHFDLVRPGYALYGGNPKLGYASTPNPMHECVKLEAEILQVRMLQAGETVGYSATWTAPDTRKIGALSVGYADGFLRSASGSDAALRGMALVDGVLCPIVGRISMDMIVLDVTQVPSAERGTMATLIGGVLNLDVVGRNAGTIGYEVLTSLGRRYRRTMIGSN